MKQTCKFIIKKRSVLLILIWKTYNMKKSIAKFIIIMIKNKDKNKNSKR